MNKGKIAYTQLTIQSKNDRKCDMSRGTARVNVRMIATKKNPKHQKKTPSRKVVSEKRKTQKSFLFPTQTRALNKKQEYPSCSASDAQCYH